MASALYRVVMQVDRPINSLLATFRSVRLTRVIPFCVHSTPTRSFTSSTSSSTSSSTTANPSATPSAWDQMDDPTRDLAVNLLDRNPTESLLRHRSHLSRAITLVESTAPKKQAQARLLLTHLLLQREDTKTSFRLGIAGAPGAGKSTFIEALGRYVLQTLPGNENDGVDQDDSDALWKPSNVAVLCVDPSSARQGGSILGDKTRMPQLSALAAAYIRPSPNSCNGSLGAYTDDVVTVTEQAGYEWIVIETVGLGQSEIEIQESVDVMVLLLPPAGGDDLQGVKKGIVEVADVLVATKSDGTLEAAAKRTAQDFRSAVQLLRQDKLGERPSVLLASAVTGAGLKEVWQEVTRLKRRLESSGRGLVKRREQRRYWMWKNLQNLVQQETKHDPVLRKQAAQLEEQLAEGTLTPRVAAAELLRCLTHKHDKDDEGDRDRPVL